MENLMLYYAKNIRITPFMLNYTISEINMAFRIAEYLEPDKQFPPNNLLQNIINLLNDKKFGKAYAFLKREINFKDFDSSYWNDVFERNAIEVMEILYEGNKQRQIDQIQIKINEQENELNRLKSELNKLKTEFKKET